MSEMDKELEQGIEEFCASIKVDKNCPFSLRDRYYDQQGKELTFKRIFVAGVEWQKKRIEAISPTSNQPVFCQKWRIHHE
jgi:hypothetical protein